MTAAQAGKFGTLIVQLSDQLQVSSVSTALVRFTGGRPSSSAMSVLLIAQVPGTPNC